MILFKILAVLFLIWVGLQLIMALFGKQIMRFLVGKLTRRMERNFWQQQNQHQQKYNPQYEQEVNLNSEVKLQVPHEQKRRMKNTKGDGIQDVDFEDVRD